MKSHKLTLKKAKFVKEYIKNGGNGTQAALKVYETNNYESASSIAHHNLSDPDIAKLIQETFNELKTTPKKYIKNLDYIADRDIKDTSPEAVIKANIEMLKIARIYPGIKNTNVNVSMKIKDMTFKEAQEALLKLRSRNDNLLSQIEQEESS